MDQQRNNNADSQGGGNKASSYEELLLLANRSSGECGGAVEGTVPEVGGESPKLPTGGGILPPPPPASTSRHKHARTYSNNGQCYSHSPYQTLPASDEPPAQGVAGGVASPGGHRHYHTHSRSLSSPFVNAPHGDGVVPIPPPVHSRTPSQLSIVSLGEDRDTTSDMQQCDIIQQSCTSSGGVQYMLSDCQYDNSHNQYNGSFQRPLYGESQTPNFSGGGVNYNNSVQPPQNPHKSPTCMMMINGRGGGAGGDMTSPGHHHRRSSSGFGGVGGSPTHPPAFFSASHFYTQGGTGEFLPDQVLVATPERSSFQQHQHQHHRNTSFGGGASTNSLSNSNLLPQPQHHYPPHQPTRGGGSYGSSPVQCSSRGGGMVHYPSGSQDLQGNGIHQRISSGGGGHQRDPSWGGQSVGSHGGTRTTPKNHHATKFQGVVPSLFHTQLQSGLRFVPFPEPSAKVVLANAGHPGLDGLAGKETSFSLFFGQVKFEATLELMLWLINTITRGSVTRGGVVPTHIHTLRAGCFKAHFASQEDKAAVEQFNDAIMFDETGVWWAQSETELKFLRVYCRDIASTLKGVRLPTGAMVIRN